MRVIIACALMLATPAQAQQAVNGGASAQIMWGTSSNGLGLGGADGSAAHVNNGMSAGQVQAAKRGWLLGPNITINAIGVQNITDVNGSGNIVTSSQSGSNSGVGANAVIGSTGAANAVSVTVNRK